LSSSVSNSVEGLVGNTGNAAGDIGAGAGDAVGNLDARDALDIGTPVSSADGPLKDIH
jgi:hypothetical protein